ncbi:hypothetical protein CHS0354_002962 [Potamilus streckersoni]|uniref:G-protein coupled receptors family 1 profile domain-containing protein n=1 Tax=Potamilus streckersoni TaxID=2493646 RepID=A0AAE0RSF8_9BIVA|nr:hypothetical protein CHS0354_002962 [Potamilus streckersoni]
MNANENKTAGLTDMAGRNMSGLDLNFEMTGYIFALYIVYLAGSMIIGVPGNSILFAIYCKHKPISNVDYYILSIAVFDLVCLLVTVPMYIVIQTKILYVIDVKTLCKALYFTGQIVTFAESFLLCALAIERFIKVCRPNFAYSLDRRVKYIIVTIFLSTVVISVPNLFFSWIINNRHCVPITKPPWIASGFFLLSVSLFIAIFVIVLLSYTSVATTLYQSLKKTTHNSIASRKITRRNKILPLPTQTELRPTTSCTHERRTHETFLHLQTNVTSIQISASNQTSKYLLTGDAACLEKHSSDGDNPNRDIMEKNENDDKDPIVMGKAAAKTDRPSRTCADISTQTEQITTKITPRENTEKKTLDDNQSYVSGHNNVYYLVVSGLDLHSPSVYQ